MSKAAQCKYPNPDAATQSSINFASWRAGELTAKGLDPGFCGHLTTHESGLCYIHRRPPYKEKLT